MTRFRAIGVALAALALSATAVAAFTLPSLPDAASNGLDKASGVLGKELPPRPDVVPPDITTQSVDSAATEDLPAAASHGAAVSDAAKPDEPPAGSDHGTTVSGIARDNHGAATAGQHTPADAGKPADVPRVDTGAPDAAGKPDGAGKPAEPGQPADPGAPDGVGKPEGVPPQH